MIVLRDLDAAARLRDPELRALVEKRIQDLEQYGPDYAPSDLAVFIVVEPGDPLAVIDQELGFPVMTTYWEGPSFGEPGFTPGFELVEDHGGFYELVFVLGDDGYGIEVFVPKHPGVPSQLLAMCEAYAVSAEDS